MATPLHSKARLPFFHPALLLLTLHLGFLLLGVTAAAAAAAAAEAAPAVHVAGHWEGQIEAPGNSITTAIDLGQADGDRWIGQIDIPAQGMTDFPLTEIEVDGASVSFAMQGIPGDPVFRGTMTGDGSEIAGEFSQGGGRVPFRLERKGDAELAAAPASPEIPPDAVAALAGRWEGKLDVPGQTLRLALVLEAGDDGGLAATLDSPDQGQTGLPVSRLAVDGDVVRAELAYAGAVYEGTLNAARTELSGSWSQGGGSLPLTLRKKAASAAFPMSDPEDVGIPAEALDLLRRRVQTMVDDDEIVGGELLVIKDRRTVLRKAFGWKNREAEETLDAGAVYCVRSMTKPFVGTAIQMLIDEGKLRLDTPVREILPFFDGPQTGKITVEHLLTHTAGFPFTTISKPLTDYADLAEVAAEAAATELGFEPGTDFEYSDAGSDTLGAVVAQITGAPVEQFIQERILDPLGMRDTVTLLGDHPEAAARIPAAYSGGTGSWTQHWDPSDPPLFPLFLTSQSLYSTTEDYARFLALWMDGGQVGDRRLLSPEAVERALAPDRRMSNYPQTLEGLDVYYGQQWMVFAPAAGQASSPETPPRPVVFGHGGSDGTHAWAWPELDLMVLFFTQSRGTLAGLGMERAMQKLLVEQDLDDPSIQGPGAEELEQMAGIYWDEDVEHAYYVVTPQGRRLTVERPGRMHLVFKAGDTPGRFVHEVRSDVWIEFVRSEDGVVSAMRTSFGGRVELDPRHVPVAGLPSAADVAAMVKKAHRADLLSELGVIRFSGTLNFETRNMEGSVTTWFDATRERTEIEIGSAQEIVVKADGRVSSYSTQAGTSELDGPRREQALLEQVSVRFGDWTEHYDEVEVLKRVVFGDDAVLLVRVVPREAPGATMFVHEESGQVAITEALAQLPGIGLVGVRTQYGDFRDVGGMNLPFRAVSTFASQLIGRVVTQWETVETGVDMPDESFAAPAE